MTDTYNHAMQEMFGDSLELVILPRLSIDGEIISATKVREALKNQDDRRLRQFLPSTTYHYLKNER